MEDKAQTDARKHIRTEGAEAEKQVLSDREHIERLRKRVAQQTLGPRLPKR